MEIIGNRFGSLVVESFSGKNKRNERLFICQCDCGNKSIVKYYNLSSGKTKSCGCISTGVERENLIGNKYNKLTVIDFVGRDKHRGTIWLCKCDCGKEKNVLRRALIVGSTKSCGCWKVEHKKGSKGVLNNNYNSNLTNDDRDNRRSNEIHEWAILVKKKYDWKCIICNSTRKLHAHHLNSYNWDKENRTNIENGVCLCKNCHIEFHIAYGLKNNTKEQFFEFKEIKENERRNN